MKTWLIRARRMTMTDWLTAVEVICLAVWIEIALKVTQFSRLLERIGRLSPGPSSAAHTSCEVRRLARFVDVAYEVLPLPATCLRRSLVLHALLERRAVRSRLCFGVARDGDVMHAHAWIECDGVASDAVAARFSELTSAPKELAHVVN